MTRAGSLFTGAVVTALLAAPADAQSMAAGNYPGWLRFPDGDSSAVSLIASRDNRNRLVLDIRTPAGMEWGLGSVRERPGRIGFTWAMDGPRPLRCSMSHRSGTTWEALCEDNVRGTDGKTLRLILLFSRELPAPGS